MTRTMRTVLKLCRITLGDLHDICRAPLELPPHPRTHSRHIAGRHGPLEPCGGDATLAGGRLGERLQPRQAAPRAALPGLLHVRRRVDGGVERERLRRPRVHRAAEASAAGQLGRVLPGGLGRVTGSEEPALTAALAAPAATRDGGAVAPPKRRCGGKGFGGKAPQPHIPGGTPRRSRVADAQVAGRVRPIPAASPGAPLSHHISGCRREGPCARALAWVRAGCALLVTHMH